MEDLRELIYRKALINAYKHNGKASLDAVVRKIVFYKPEIKKEIKKYIEIIKEVVEEVNSLSLDEQYSILLVRYPEELKEEKVQVKRFEFPVLHDLNKKVVTRFAPNPDGPLHIGNIRSALLSYEYSKRFDGKFILRFEDTDPRTKKPILHLSPSEKMDYQYIIEDLEWLGIIPDEIYIQSDRLNIYYKCIEELLKKGFAYVCLCSKEEIKENRMKGIECVHRNSDPEHNLKLFYEMLNGGIKNGVIRIKTDMKHEDPSVRDWIAFRIIDPKIYVHPRIEKIKEILGYEPYLWPTYNFSVSIDDHFMGVTLVFRAKEHINNTIKQSYIFKYFNWEEPKAIHYGRIKVAELTLSKSKIVKGYKDFSDPDLATIIAFRKRGFLPESIKNVILELGIKPIEATISLENLYSINRKLIDYATDRYFFVYDPVVVKLKISEKITIRRQLHPSRKDFFEFELEPNPEILICKNDLEGNEFEVRLISLGNFKIKKLNGNFEGELLKDHSLEYARERNLKFIQWVPSSKKIKCKIITPSKVNKNKLIEGYCEAEVSKLKVNTVIQFLRFGFVKLDKKDDEYLFYYLHD
jgi:glutamyl-tRNA synthetase